MKKFLVALIAAIAIVGVAAPSNASRGHHYRFVASTGCYDASPGVVTQWEYNHADLGMTRAEIACLFGTDGFTSYFWPPNNNYAVVEYHSSTAGQVDTLRYRLDSPSQQILVEKFQN